MALTPRQRQVAALKKLGASDKEIAMVLGIGVETVRSHNKLIREHLRAMGLDLFAMPMEQAQRIKAFADVARLEYYRIKADQQAGMA